MVTGFLAGVIVGYILRWVFGPMSCSEEIEYKEWLADLRRQGL